MKKILEQSRFSWRYNERESAWYLSRRGNAMTIWAVIASIYALIIGNKLWKKRK